jgi:tetratricopeptide (TPR) repeat protein
VAGPHLEGADDDAWLDRLAADDDNLRAALNWARESGETDALLAMTKALAWYWWHCGSRRDGLMWMESALAMAGDAPPGIRAAVMGFAGSHAMDLGRYEAARQLLEGSLACSAEAGEPSSPVALHALGVFELESQHADLALQRCEEALTAARERGATFDELDSLWYVVMVCALGADPERALALSGECVEAARRFGNNYCLGQALQAAGHAWLRTDPRQALAAFEETGRKLYGAEASTHSQLDFFRGIAWLRLGELLPAARCLSEALARFEQGGNRFYLSNALALVARLAARSDSGTAARLLAAADRFLDDLGLGGTPLDVAARRRLETRLSEAMGSAEFSAAFDEGWTLDLEQAVGLAHGVLDGLAADA